MKESKFSEISVIENGNVSSGKGPEFLTEEATAAIQRLHRGLPDYKPTPLVRLDNMAKRLGLRAVFVKDESKRFGLNAFKALGSIYAITRIVCRELGLKADTVNFADLKSPVLADKIQKMVFATATDGNHGRGVSWAAGQLGCAVHIFMPVGSSEIRAQAIRDVNPAAEVIIMDACYDDTVRFAASQAEKYGWYLVQDTSWEGYEEVPMWITQGYTTMALEAKSQMDEQGLKPTHVFVQAGVGSMAGGVIGCLANAYEGERPKFAVVEPETIACIYESARVNDGAPHAAVNQRPTIMAGLNCGEPCTIVWPVLRDFSDFYLACSDEATKYGMRLLAKPEGDDPVVISGESGAVSIGLLNLITGKPEYSKLRKILGLDENSVFLCFSTEGDMDPQSWHDIVVNGK